MAHEYRNHCAAPSETCVCGHNHMARRSEISHKPHTIHLGRNRAPHPSGARVDHGLLQTAADHKGATMYPGRGTVKRVLGRFHATTVICILLASSVCAHATLPSHFGKHRLQHVTSVKHWSFQFPYQWLPNGCILAWKQDPARLTAPVAHLFDPHTRQV